MTKMLHFTPMGDKIVACLDPDGPLIASETQIIDIISGCAGSGATHVALPKQRLAGNFFDMSNGLLRAVVQKFVDGGLVPVLIGDFSSEAKTSVALRNFIRDGNKRKQPVFVGSLEGLEFLLD